MEHTSPKSLIDLMPFNIVTNGKDHVGCCLNKLLSFGDALDEYISKNPDYLTKRAPEVVIMGRPDDKVSEFSRLQLSSGLALVKYTDGTLYTVDEQYDDWTCVTDPILKEVLTMLQSAECHIDGLQRQLDPARQKVEIQDEPRTTQLKQKVTAFTKLRELLGYVENGTDTTVALFQDDATHNYIVKIGHIKNGKHYYGDSLELAIEAAHKANQDN